ncbi:PSH1 [Candida margitis]|uniref:PSH1 n=1 Tax=Candida margitis TaxID=1775924 RepID=UPI0022269268|nr:PSH1 [Candida margitis]KAI5970395.1 PSH1 [Candida margitis]
MGDHASEIAWDKVDSALTSNLLSKITNSLECSICSEVMLAPMTTECGHSFCYECLHQWFKNKINCPTCRHEIQTKPALNMKLNEISKNLTELIIDAKLDPNVDSFVSRKKEAISNYESHAKKKRVFGELFCGYSLTLIDNSDGVPRCGNCLWEAHGTVCLHCGSRFRNADLIRSADDDDEDEDEDEFYQDVPQEEDQYDSDDSFIDSRTAEEILGEMHDNRQEDSDVQQNASPSEENLSSEDGTHAFRNWMSGNNPRSHVIYISDTDSEFEYNPRIYSDSDDDSPQHMHYGGGPGGNVIIDLDADDEENDAELIDALAEFQHGISEDEEGDEFRSLHEGHENEYDDDDDDDADGDHYGDNDAVNIDNSGPEEYYDEYDVDDDDDDDDVDDDNDNDNDDQNDYEDDSYGHYNDYDDEQVSDSNW